MKLIVASAGGIALCASLSLLMLGSPHPDAPLTSQVQGAPAHAQSEAPKVRPIETRAKVRTPEETVSFPPAEPARVGGTIRDANGDPIAFADVYLALHPPRSADDDESALYLRADYFDRTRLFETKTDENGHYEFADVRVFGDATLGGFKKGYSSPRGIGSTGRKAVSIEEGAMRDDVDLVMAPGQSLTGSVRTRDGAPVVDAVVSVHTAWTATSHVFWPAGLGPTDAAGRFRVSIEEETAACHVRVNSKAHGQSFFLEVPVESEDAELTMSTPARVEGTITWTGGSPAAGLTVRVHGRPPEPPIPVRRLGSRSYTVNDGLVGPDGTYAIEGLHPHLTYEIFVIDGSLGKRMARRRPLTPARRSFVRLGAGEVKVWNRELAKPMTLTGRIRTLSGDLLPHGRVGLLKDGKTLPAGGSVEANDEGFFKLHLNTGPGEYLVLPEPPGNSPAPDPVRLLLAKRFGRTVHLVEGGEIEVDLEIFMPALLPVRVLDHNGAAVERIRARLRATLPNGRSFSQETSYHLDETGRITFPLYVPLTEFSFAIRARSGDRTVETPRQASEPGTLLLEETVILPPPLAE